MKVLGFLLGLTVLSGVPLAQAEGVSVSADLIGSCLSGLEREKDKRICVGLAAQNCAQSGELSACLDAEIAYWEARLTVGFGMALDRAQGKDSDAVSLELETRDQAVALRTAQDSWQAYRRATCAFEQTLWETGAASSPEAQGCHLYLTAEQTFYLEAVALIE
ncbi:lysozyme inhibitor LprI family protein [Shimia sagamensis]|uniref:Lysozyme inhibitor LprI-like N-terminal domain-containing protein n=1 Tax=Shimia sagamensis TaxID=1566352 RepID=A0ABY1PBM3_9RHOB|nr:lysozyme inhibitor LprI family protein [Shimia sagamensis]SMP30623.1 Protein of unknown function [Shimia sagamensis]